MMTNENSAHGQTENPDAFALIVGPVALDQAEKALAKSVMAHVARIAVLKVTRTAKTVGIAQETGREILIDFARHVYGITPAQAVLVIDDAIEKARYALRKAA